MDTLCVINYRASLRNDRIFFQFNVLQLLK